MGRSGPEAQVSADFADSCGGRHGAGDTVLREVAWRLAASARVEDVVGRGGEEFIVILPHCDVEGAFVVSERIRDAVAASPIQCEGGATIPVTVSVGCTGGTDHSLVERADAALCPSP
jgi:two-component system, cell cycle response regulator